MNDLLIDKIEKILDVNHTTSKNDNSICGIDSEDYITLSEIYQKYYKLNKIFVRDKRKVCKIFNKYPFMLIISN